MYAGHLQVKFTGEFLACRSQRRFGDGSMDNGGPSAHRVVPVPGRQKRQHRTKTRIAHSSTGRPVIRASVRHVHKTSSNPKVCNPGMFHLSFHQIHLQLRENSFGDLGF